MVQQAYECLSDPAERKWYDQHREAILKGWSASGGGENVSVLFDVVPYQYAGCYDGYGNDEEGFFAVYRMVFQKVYEGEESGWTSEGNIENFPLSFLPTDFGDGNSKWEDVGAFYKGWESYSSCLGFAWADQYDTKEAPDRRVRRAMEDENKKARRKARKERNEDILALVHFVKRRDPRVKARQEQVARERQLKEMARKEETEHKKARAAEARESWKVEQEQVMAEFEEEDRIAGRIRLADLDDDYDYGGGKRGKKGKKKNKRRSLVVDDDSEQEAEAEDDKTEGGEAAQSAEQGEEFYVDNGESEVLTDAGSVDPEDAVDYIQEQEYLSSEQESEAESEPEPDIWRCECCRKDFKSHGQMENHMKSKKHKAALKKFQAKEQNGSEIDDLIDNLALDP